MAYYEMKCDLYKSILCFHPKGSHCQILKISWRGPLSGGRNLILSQVVSKWALQLENSQFYISEIHKHLPKRLHLHYILRTYQRAGLDFLSIIQEFYIYILVWTQISCLQKMFD